MAENHYIVAIPRDTRFTPSNRRRPDLAARRRWKNRRRRARRQ